MASYRRKHPRDSLVLLRGLSFFIEKWRQPRIKVDTFLRETGGIFDFGWEIKNVGRVGIAENIDINFTIGGSVFVPYRGMDIAPEKKQSPLLILLRYVKGENDFTFAHDFGVYSEHRIISQHKDVKFPIGTYDVRMKVFGQNLRDEDKWIRRYTLSFVQGLPKIESVG